ncbi:MAG: 4'-phosphopantetheinyl transferase superfamily protein [Thermodesulfobacteriota bacterium]
MPFIDNSSLPVSISFIVEKLGLTSPLQLSVLQLANLEQRLESGDLEPGVFLDTPEQEQYNRYQYKKRKLEWLGGRLAAKKAALKMAGEEPSWQAMLAWPVAADENGRPFFRSQQSSSLRLSISHSGELAGALVVSGKECGLDLQKISSATVRVKEKFCSPTENDIISTLQSEAMPDSGLTLLWSAKEALRKARGGNPLTGFLEMELVEAVPTSEAAWIFTIKAKNILYRIIVFFYNDFAFAMTTTPLDQERN